MQIVYAFTLRHCFVTTRQCIIFSIEAKHFSEIKSVACIFELRMLRGKNV